VRAAHGNAAPARADIIRSGEQFTFPLAARRARPVAAAESGPLRR